MTNLKDPTRDRLLAELRLLRRMPGVPSVGRLSGQDELIEALGYGDVERAWARLERLREEYGGNPETDIGAYFYLAGWGVGRDTLDQRIAIYHNEFHCNERTALRRGDRGAIKLATLIRDRAESNRPWGLINVFQRKSQVDFIVRLMMSYESWRPAEIKINGEAVSDPVFTLHQNPDVVGGYYHQLIAEAVPIKASADTNGSTASIVVHWPMPVWPTWQSTFYISDARAVSRVRTFRDRGVEVRLEWSLNTPREPAHDCRS